MEFCPKCGSLMIPVKKKKNIYMHCKKCGYEKKKILKSMKISEKKEIASKVVVITKQKNKETSLPLTDKICPKCNNSKAYWWLQQTRSMDEPPTQFYRCSKCGYTWREYK